MAPDSESWLLPVLPLPLFSLRTISLKLLPFLLTALRTRVQLNKLKRQCLWENGFVGSVFLFCSLWAGGIMLLEEPCDVISENAASHKAKVTDTSPNSFDFLIKELRP